jgi:RHS repeat-associated protein
MKRTTLSTFLFLVVLAFLRCAAAQVPTGTPSFGTFGGGPFDVVNLGNLNAHFTIPVIRKLGRGSSYTYSLSYDTSVWYPVGTSGSQTWTPVSQYGWVFPPAPGWLTYKIVSTYQQPCNPPSNMNTNTMTVYAFFVYHEINGTSHPFNDGYTYPYIQGCISGNPNPSTAVAADGSGYSLSVGGSSNISIVTAPDGTVYNLNTGINSKTDANGNQITESTSGTIIDTLGQTVLTMTGTNPLNLTYTVPTGGSASYVVNYTTYNIKTNFACNGITEYSANSVPLVSSIDLPDGTFYTFAYEQTPNNSGYTTARLIGVTLPTGGSITYSYPGANDGIVCADGSTLGLNRTLSSPGGEWSYARTQVSGLHWQTVVSSPPDPVNSGNASDITAIDFQQDGNTTYPTYNFYETQRKVYQGSATGTPLETLTTCYNANFASCVATGVLTPINQLDRYTQLGTSLSSLSEFTYNSTYGLLIDDKEYGYGVTTGVAPGHTDLVRETAITYANLGNNIYNKPASVIVYDWSSGRQVTLKSSTYGYDQTAVTPLSGTPQHVSITGSRGNLTTVAAQANASSTIYQTFAYFDTGNPQTVSQFGTTSTGLAMMYTYNYSDATSTCGNSFPTTVTEPLSLSKSFTWNCVGGVMLTAKDENGKTVTTDYTTDTSFWRPDYVLDKLQNKTTLNYYTMPTSTESTLTFNSGKSVSDFRVTVDGFGRPSLSQQQQAPLVNEYDSTETDYNVMGQASRFTVPFQALAGIINSSAPGTTATYDALGRPWTVTDGGGGTVKYQYIMNDVLQTIGPAPANENMKVKQFEIDGLGRLTSVCEVTAGSGNWLGGNCAQMNPLTGYLTTYSYDAMGNLLTVTQNAQATSNQQTRRYVYDMLGRLTSETNPETGNGAPGTFTYTYDSACGSYSASARNLTKRVDNAGNTTCYGYDPLQRLTDAGNSGPTCRHFRYDAQTPPSGVTVSNISARMAEAYTDNCASTKITDEWYGYDADGNVTDTYESTPNSGGYYHSQVSYWANGTIASLSALKANATAIFPTIYYGTSTGAGLDGEGRVVKVNAASGTNPVTGATYVTSGTSEPIGALTAMTLGSTDQDSFTFDPNTGRPATYTFKINGVNDTGRLTWNANGTLNKLVIADSLTGTADSQTCNYLYDDLGRNGLKPGLPGPPTNYGVNCSTAWQQNFTYDPFGNITKAGSGAFQPTYSPTTNQFLSIPGVTKSYDANGNLLTDNLNTYTWDPTWGNMLSVNTGSTTVTATYDALGRTLEQYNGSTYSQILYSPVGRTAVMSGQTLIKAFISLPGGGTAIYNSSSVSPVYYRHGDWLGSSRLTSTASSGIYSSQAYAPFGDQYSTAGASGPTSSAADPNFTGQNSDTVSSLYDFTFRENSMSQGRWISPDPAGLAAVDPTNPQSWNRYAYAANEPCDTIDLLGLCNFNIAVTNTKNLTDAEAKSAWNEIERLFGLAGLGAMFTSPQNADFTENLTQNGAFGEPDDMYGLNSCTWTPCNSATIYQNNVENDAGGMNMGVALGRDMFHEFIHWALNMGRDGTNGSLDQGIMTPGALGTFMNGYATLTPQQIDILKQKCKAQHGSGGSADNSSSGQGVWVPIDEYVYGSEGDEYELVGWGYFAGFSIPVARK